MSTARARRSRVVLSMGRQEAEIVARLLDAHAATLNASQMESFIVRQLRDRLERSRERVAC